MIGEKIASQADPIAVIGRGHSGTSMLSHMLFASRVFMGRWLNEYGDMLPPQSMYDAATMVGERVRWKGGLSWDFANLHASSVDPKFEELVHAYLEQVLSSERPSKGWKLPETTLVYPWLVRMLPSAHYIHIVRDPRDCLLRSHRTDDLRDCNVPGPDSDDELAHRVASWAYHHEIVRATPQPERFISVRYEDLVLDYDATTRRLEAFLGIPLARVVVDKSRVGQWGGDRRLLPYLSVLEPQMRELGYT